MLFPYGQVILSSFIRLSLYAVECVGLFRTRSLEWFRYSTMSASGLAAAAAVSFLIAVGGCSRCCPQESAINHHSSTALLSLINVQQLSFLSTSSQFQVDYSSWRGSYNRQDFLDRHIRRGLMMGLETGIYI